MALAGAPADPAHVVITSGTMDAITLALRVVCRPGDTVLVESPTYFGLLQSIEHLNLKVVEVPNCSVTGIDVEAVRAVARSTRLGAAVLMPNFNNPCGSLTPDDAKREIVQILTGSEVPIIEDDIYGDLHYGGRRPTSLRAFDDSGLVIRLVTDVAFGYRIGWAVSRTHAKSRAPNSIRRSLARRRSSSVARYYASGGYDRYLRRVADARCSLSTRSMLSRNSSPKARVSRSRREAWFCGSSCRARRRR
jgi:DNA-binding transcriptional MocR family regulator